MAGPMHALQAMRAIVWREVAKFSRQTGRLVSALVRPLRVRHSRSNQARLDACKSPAARFSAATSTLVSTNTRLMRPPCFLSFFELY